MKIQILNKVRRALWSISNDTTTTEEVAERAKVTTSIAKQALTVLVAKGEVVQRHPTNQWMRTGRTP